MFSDDLMLAIEREAATAGLRGATNISVAVRTQLNARATRTDGREKTYWVAGRVVQHGKSYPLPGATEITGLNSVGALVIKACAHVALAHDVRPMEFPNEDCIDKAETNAGRVGMTRNGHAHFCVVLPHSRKSPAVPDAWVDLYAYPSRADAEDAARKIPSGKVA